MNSTILLRVLAVAAVCVALAGTPISSFAQHGGHGGGGFHGGGGGFHGGGFGGHAGGGFRGGSPGGFHGGGGFGNFEGRGFHDGGFSGFHNGGFGGFRGGRGFGGFRGDRFFGGFGGYPFFYGFDFGFWPYWGAYPYWYGYGPWWGPYAYYSPYDYPDYPYDAPPDRYPRDDRRCRPDYRHPDNGCNDSSPDTSKPNPENPPAKPSNTLGPESSPERNYVTTNFADYRTDVSNSDGATPTTIAVTATVASPQSANSTAQQVSSKMRPELRNAIEALRAMPPEARERQLNSGRYDAFSPEERKLLNNDSRLAPTE